MKRRPPTRRQSLRRNRIRWRIVAGKNDVDVTERTFRTKSQATRVALVLLRSVSYLHLATVRAPLRTTRQRLVLVYRRSGERWSVHDRQDLLHPYKPHERDAPSTTWFWKDRIHMRQMSHQELLERLSHGRLP
jgi:hypothetical protein